MAGGNVGVRLTLDAGQMKSQVSDITKQLQQMNEALAEATQAGDWGNVATLSSAMSNLQDTKTSMNREVESVAKQQQSTNAKPANTIVNAANNAQNYVQTFAQGNYASTAISGMKGIGGTLRNVGSDTGGVLGGLATAGGVLALVTGAAMAGGKALADKYEEQLPAIDSFNALYGKNVGTNSYQENSFQGFEYYKKVADKYSKDTGKTNAEFLQLSNNLSRYGVSNAEIAMKKTQDDIKWANYTNGNLDLIQQITGMSSRYGMQGNAMQQAYAGVRATGLAKGQTDEFLNSMLRVMQEGISKGFVLGADEIAGNMSMLYKLSGNNEMWQGENGASKLSTINSAFENATALQSSEDMIIFNVAQKMLDGKSLEERQKILGKNATVTGGYTDTLQLMEQGLKNPELLQGVFDTIGQLDGKNKDALASRFASMFGLNYTQAAQMVTISENYSAQKAKDPNFSFNSYAEEVNSIFTAHDFKSDKTQAQNSKNELEKVIAETGKGVNALATKGLEELTNISSKLDNVLAKMLVDKDEIKEASEGLFSKSENKNKKALQDLIVTDMSNGETRDKAMQALGMLSSLTEEEKAYANATNFFNNPDNFYNVDKLKLPKWFTTDEDDSYDKNVISRLSENVGVSIKSRSLKNVIENAAENDSDGGKIITIAELQEIINAIDKVRISNEEGQAMQAAMQQDIKQREALGATTINIEVNE